MEKRVTLVEQIVQRVSNLFRRSAISQEYPDTDSATEVRRREDDASAQSMLGGAYDWYLEETELGTSRLAKYREYELMDTEMVELSSALDIYADNATKGDRDKGEEVIEIVSEEERIKDVLEEVKKRLDLDSELWSIAREMVKYGDNFEEVVVYPDLEVHRLKHLPPETMRVVQDRWGRLDSEYPFEQVNEAGTVVAKLQNWQVLHFKMKKKRESRYGVDGSILFPIRKVYKQLAMMEDGMVIARLTRSPQRYGFLIDVDGIDPGQPTIDYLNKVRDMMKKRRTIDPTTGKMDLSYNPLSMEEDLFIGVRGNTRADVKVLQGEPVGDMADIEYFHRKMFAGIKVPRAWIGFEADTRARSVITELDVQFARTVRRIQQILIAELRKLFDFVLLTRGFDPGALEYQIKLPILSTIDELREWEIAVIKASLAKMYKHDLNVSTRWVLTHLLDFSDEDLEEIMMDIEDPESIENLRVRAAVDAMGGYTGLPGEEEEETEAVLLPRELQLVKFRLREHLDSLHDLLNWKHEHRTGKSVGK